MAYQSRLREALVVQMWPTVPTTTAVLNSASVVFLISSVARDVNLPLASAVALMEEERPMGQLTMVFQQPTQEARVGSIQQTVHRVSAARQMDTVVQRSTFAAVDVKQAMVLALAQLKVGLISVLALVLT
jgi:hypothetical protein